MTEKVWGWWRRSVTSPYDGHGRECWQKDYTFFGRCFADDFRRYQAGRDVGDMAHVSEKKDVYSPTERMHQLKNLTYLGVNLEPKIELDMDEVFL